MDPLRNPFAPGAGSRPPELALRRVRLGRAEKSQMLLGLRGVGKTVLLNRIAELAESIGYEQAQLEAPEGRPLATYLVPALKSMLLRFDRVEQARAWASEAMGLKVERTGPLRSGLIRKGMVWSPAHGMTAFTMPLFDAFMQRAMGQCAGVHGICSRGSGDEVTAVSPGRHQPSEKSCSRSRLPCSTRTMSTSVMVG